MESDSERCVTGRLVTLASTALAMLVVFGSQVVGQEIERSSRFSAEMLRKVEHLPNLPIVFETQEAAPLAIQEAHLKEITKAEFRRLTGAAAESTRYAAFPKVTYLTIRIGA